MNLNKRHKATLRRCTIICYVFWGYGAVFSQSPNWDSIRSHISLQPDDPTEFDVPFIQPHYNDGWEDGLYITRDGLHLYSTYVPADLISVVNNLTVHPVCPDFTAYIQEPLLGVDIHTNPWGCDNILHSDIIYASRTDTAEHFVWRPSNLATPAYWESGACGLQNQSGKMDIFVYAKSHSEGQDLFWILDTDQNPIGPGIIMPDSVNSPNFSEDNPHIERIDDSLMVLMLDNHPDAGESADIFYSISQDNGATWSQKRALSSINTPREDIHPHLWNDGSDWWLYFAATDTEDEYERLAIFRSKQGVANDFNSWGPRERIIGVGQITDGSGTIIALGEPTLTKWGDISFVCAIMANPCTDSTDCCELDPWYMKRKNPITNTVKQTRTIPQSFSLEQNYPNPFN
ncbi:exo-alpha-sialidase, partial [candidate division KSB1 bacterium]|nr:exo-alpha-sialidase [candidate division KSB1 bacterium]